MSDKMTFKGEPSMLVRLNPPIGNHRHIRFDGNGEFSTDNSRLIRRLEGKFECATGVKELKLPPADKSQKEVKVKTCKKCGFQTTSQGELLKHYKVAHPKEG